MALQIGIVGLPNVGKSTLFNALTKSKGADAQNFPFCTIDPNKGIVSVPDERLTKLSEIVSPEKIIPATVEFVDIAGLVKGAHKGEGLGNQFLGAIREVHAICHLVRFFEDGGITHVEGSVHPQRDRETIEAELILADLELVDARLEKIAGSVRSGDKEKIKEQGYLEQIKEKLNAGVFAYEIVKDIDLTEFSDAVFRMLLTAKPVIFGANVAEDQLQSTDVSRIKDQLGLNGNEEVIAISAKIEEDLQDLSDDDAKEFLESLGVSSSGLDTLIQAAYKTLGYITYFTAGPKEVRAWTITEGMTAPQAAGVIHTDFEKGFIRAETIAYPDYIDGNGEQGAKEAGKMRAEGKEYVVKDGDVMHFRFSS